MTGNRLHLGDNLVALRTIPDRSADLVYLDPPFLSRRDYTASDAGRPGARVRAFDDTWRWDAASAAAFDDLIRTGPDPVARAMAAFGGLLPKSDMLAYLAMMAPRLVELHRVLKATGSLYLHCDPSASHYLKVLLDATFGPRRHRNEIIWKRSSAHSDAKQGMRRCGKIHDVLLLYTRSEDSTWNPLFTPYTEGYLESEYKRVDESGRRYAESNPTAAKPGGDTEYLWRVRRKAGAGERWEADLDDDHLDPKPGQEYRGVPPYRGRYWAYSKAKMIEFARAGALHHRETGVPRIRLYADRMPGIPLQDVWDDIPPELGRRHLGYPTQKPRALLERIIALSSNPGDVVLDPFCGSGTTLDAAQALGRRWIGIDAAPLPVGLTRDRLAGVHGLEPGADYEVVDRTPAAGAHPTGRPGRLPDSRTAL